VHATLVGEMRVLRVQDKYIVGAKTRVGVTRAREKRFRKSARKGVAVAAAHATLVSEKRSRSSFSGESFRPERFFRRRAHLGRPRRAHRPFPAKRRKIENHSTLMFMVVDSVDGLLKLCFSTNSINI